MCTSWFDCIVCARASCLLLPIALLCFKILYFELDHRSRRASQKDILVQAQDSCWICELLLLLLFIAALQFHGMVGSSVFFIHHILFLRGSALKVCWFLCLPSFMPVCMLYVYSTVDNRFIRILDLHRHQHNVGFCFAFCFL